jgi:mannose-6-phosphate isomerase-like protein (cupin superfamily)
MKLQRLNKPWGYELLLAHTERYAGKILYIRAGHRLSFQCHTTKDETLVLLEGETELELETETRERFSLQMDPEQSYRVRAGQWHRLTGLTDARVLEVSTPELDDIVRLEDDYGRATVLPSPHPATVPSAAG